MLIIEILLTIFAWKKGWGWKAIIPIASAFGIGVLVGASGVVVSPAIILVDVAAIIALIVMVSVAPENKPITPEPLKNEPPKED